jgi:hypothetical protein
MYIQETSEVAANRGEISSAGEWWEVDVGKAQELKYNNYLELFGVLRITYLHK